MLDVDDLTSIVLGATIGMLIHISIEKHVKCGCVVLKKCVPGVLIIANLIGCIMVAVPAAKSDISTRITEQFWFSISSVTVDDTVVIGGECYLYDRATPDYTILVGGEPVDTVVDGKQFKAELLGLEEKAEVQIKFKGRPLMPTGTWINPTARGAEVEYVSGDVPVIPSLPETAVLKTRNEAYDTLVYQDGDRLLWLIGTEIDKNTEVIYHIHTDEPERLPENRVQYGFDNRGFRPPADERASNELEPIDHYRVFEREIPDEYNVTAIVVGFNTDGIITWNDSFRSE